MATMRTALRWHSCQKKSKSGILTPKKEMGIIHATLKAADAVAVGVGIMISHNFLRGSERADFPHAALTLGNDAYAAQRIWMIYANR
jgi:hypothetical protein